MECLLILRVGLLNRNPCCIAGNTYSTAWREGFAAKNCYSVFHFAFPEIQAYHSTAAFPPGWEVVIASPPRASILHIFESPLLSELACTSSHRGRIQPNALISFPIILQAFPGLPDNSLSL